MGIPQASSLQTSISQIDKSHNGILEIGTTQVGIAQIGITKVDSFVVDNAPQTPNGKVNPTQISSTQINPHQLTYSEISLPSSIPFQQFFNFQPWQKFFIIHNLTLESINTYKDNPLTLWNTLFNLTFNINFQISDLPPRQLAEAQITQYDPSHPNGGTSWDAMQGCG